MNAAKPAAETFPKPDSDLTGVRPAPATRADVARMAGVSTAVVSYVVNDGPRPVAAATALRVREAMELLDYRPNANARALRRGTTDTLGLVVADSLNPYFTQYTFELVTAAAARGSQLLIADSRQNEATEARIVEEFISRQVDGLLFASPFARFDQSRALLTARIPSVLIDCPGPVPGRRTVGSAADAGAEMLVRHLVEHGRRTIGLVIGVEGFGSPDPRESGWRLALREAGLPDGPIARVPFSREGGYDAAATLLADRSLDAVFASNDLQALGLVRALHEQRVRIPDDVAVVSFDGTKESEFCWPPLTVARQDLPKLAAAALDLLNTPDVARGTHIQIDTEFVRRASCGCAPAVTSDKPWREVPAATTLLA